MDQPFKLYPSVERMRLPDFTLERYLAAHEFTAPYPLSSSDCESLSLRELLAFEAPGHPDLRHQIARLYQTVSADDVLVHAGAEEAIYNFMNVTLKAGDHVIVHWPCYQSLFQVAESLGCEVTRWEANADRGWELDLEALRKAFRPHTKVVVINTPHNPTGYLMKRPLLEAAATLAEQYGATLFVDEVYRGLEYAAAEKLPAGADLSETAVSLGVMSKAYGLAGLRIGWVATRDSSLLKKLAHFKDYTSICNSAPSEFLATLALKHGDAIIGRNRKIIAENLTAADGLFADFPAHLDWHRPTAGCIAFPKWKGQGSSPEFCGRVLKETGVLLADSSLFNAGERHFRLGFGRRNFAEGLARLADFLRRCA